MQCGLNGEKTTPCFLAMKKHPVNCFSMLEFGELLFLGVTLKQMKIMVELKKAVKTQNEDTCDVLLKVIERFRELDAEMQAQSIAVLLKVAKHPVPIKMGEIAAELGLSQSTVSRNVAYLGDWNRHKKDGFKLLEAFEDPMERRRKLVRLTPKGTRFIKSLSDILTI